MMHDGRLRVLEPHGASSETELPGTVVVASLECEIRWEDEGLDERLARLRAIGGTCKPLLDCLCCQTDLSLDPTGLQAVLRAEVGSMAVCGGVEKAEQVALRERCSVVCCQGTRLAEYRECMVPEIRWTEWPSGRELQDP